MDSLLQFQGPYRFLSNFYIEPDGTSVEVEYQALKCADVADIEKFCGLTPAQAKRLGRKIKIRADWDIMKVGVMRGLVERKFREWPSLQELLLKTKDSELIEGNSWGDSFWGVTDNGLGTGQNKLGKILMTIRDELGANNGK